jgi:hypothetical protein
MTPVPDGISKRWHGSMMLLLKTVGARLSGQPQAQRKEEDRVH